MNSTCSWTGLLAGVLATCCLTSSAAAQQPGTKVALIDVRFIFENNNRFKATMDAMKQEVEGFEDQLTQKKNELKQKAEQLQTLKTGSPEYRRLEAQLAGQAADLQVEEGLKKKEIMEREARVFYEAYTEVVSHTAAICSRNNIGLVMRYNSTPIDQQNRNSVLQGVNRSIVYQSKLDITGLVLQSINSRVPTGRNNVSRQQIPQPTTKPR